MASGAVPRRWIRSEVDEAGAAALAGAGFHPRMARLLASRGVTDATTARRYLNPRLADLPDPFLMKDVERAAHRVADAIQGAEAITLFGDYDVDGVTSSALLASFLQAHGVSPRVYIPKRLTEGYGLNQDAVETVAGWGTRLLITLDCGITASDEIARANGLGLDVIVVDHHKCPPSLPPALATLNPHQDDCPYPDKVLAAVGVCFNLVIATRKVLRDRGVYRDQQGEPNLRRMMDLVALGTIADMVPLTGVNRVVTWFGMDELRAARRPGVRALMDVSRVRAFRCGSTDVGFRLGPRINAAGRLSDATIGVQLLLSEQIDEARRLAETLDVANSNRQRIEADVYYEAVRRVEQLAELPVAIVLSDPDWHPGVVGIVCSKLVERYDRPAVLVGEGGRGSARTARGLHLYDALNDCRGFLSKFGGHRAAAGFRIPSTNMGAFTAAFLTRVESDPSWHQATESTLIYDDDITPEEIDRDCFLAIRALEPFGTGNPQPLFRVPTARVKRAARVGNDHLKLRLEEGRFGGLEAIAFKRGELLSRLSPGVAVELAAHLDLHEFAGLESLQLRVRDLRSVGAPSA